MSKKEIIIIFILITIACVRFLFFIPKAQNYTESVGKIVSLDGIVSDDPDIRLSSKHLNVTLLDKDINILVIIDRNTEVSYGDEIKVRGILENPENFITQSGKEFNYKRYLANQDIYYVIKKAEIKIISHGHGSIIKSWLYNLRRLFMENINRVIPVPESDLANGLILGARGGFDNEMKNEFINTGTIHIVALSGYNVSIVADGIMKVFGLIFSEIISIIFGVVVIILFVIMAGASPTAIRAGIMAVIMLLGRMTGRRYDAGRALVVAGLLMITIDLRVLSDMSFQLSFIATFGILFVTPKVIKWVKFLPLRFGIRELMASTIAATISVLPVLLYLTGVLSLVSIPANILILLFIPITMLFSFIVGVVGFISPILSIPFGYIAHLLLLYILSVIHFFASLSFTSMTIQSFPLLLTMILYIFIIWWVFGKQIKN